MTIVQDLKTAGIKSSIRERGGDPFTMGPDRWRKSLWIHPGIAELTAYPEQEHKQAVLEVVEGDRTITRNVTVPAMSLITARLDMENGNRFPLVLPPDRTTYTVADITETAVVGNWARYRGRVTAQIKESRQHFLVGLDETHYFISVLPRAVKSVTKAHEALRPKGLPQNALRQGEWFFVPASKKKAAELTARIAKTSFNRGYRNPLALPLDGEPYSNNSHWGASVLEDKVRIAPRKIRHDHYVIGFVVDNQRHHPPLWLGEWHRIVHNLELDPPPTPHGRTYD